MLPLQTWVLSIPSTALRWCAIWGLYPIRTQLQLRKYMHSANGFHIPPSLIPILLWQLSYLAVTTVTSNKNTSSNTAWTRLGPGILSFIRIKLKVYCWLFSLRFFQFLVVHTALLGHISMIQCFCMNHGSVANIFMIRMGHGYVGPYPWSIWIMDSDGSWWIWSDWLPA